MVLNTEFIGITGGSGLLGMHVISLFLSKNYKIITFSRNKPKVKHKNLYWVKLDLNNNLPLKKLDKIFSKLACLIHIGAFVPDGKITPSKNYINRINVTTSLRLARWSKTNNKHFIFLSGAIIYKDEKKKNSERSKLKFKSKDTYINSKILSDKSIIKLRNKKFKLTILRPTSIYGHGMKSNKIISIFINKIKNHKNIQIVNNKDTKINLIHAQDVAIGVFKSYQKKKYGIFNLGQNQCVNFLKIAKTIKKILNSKSKITITKNLNYSNTLNPMDVKIQLAKKILLWTPSVNLRKGLKLQIGKKCI